MSYESAAGTVCANCGSPLHGIVLPFDAGRRLSARMFTCTTFSTSVPRVLALRWQDRPDAAAAVDASGAADDWFLSGHRARYLSPVRLYLTCSLLFFGALALAPDVSRNFVTVRYRPSPGDAPVDAAAIRQWEEAASARAGNAIVHDFPRLMFALMPVFGVLTWLFYRRARPSYAAHLYASLHFHAFAFFILTLTVPLVLLGARPVARLAPLAIIAYLYPSLRRVFGGSRWQVAWKGTLIWFVYAIVVLLTLVATGWRGGLLSSPLLPSAEPAGHEAPQAH